MTWKCPKCGREFSRQNQGHYCVKPQTIDEYITAQDENCQPRLREIRAVLLSASGIRPGCAVFCAELT